MTRPPDAPGAVDGTEARLLIRARNRRTPHEQLGYSVARLDSGGRTQFQRRESGQEQFADSVSYG